MTLTKSDYVLFLAHPAMLWLKKHASYKLPSIDTTTQRIFDTGHRFEAFAEELFPDGIKLGFENKGEYQTLPQRTKEAIDRGELAIFQGRFEVDDLTCIVDILEKVNDSEYNLIEVKSSTRVKPEHIPDLAFQSIVLQKAGIKLHSISVIHVNNSFIRQDNIEPGLICSRTDITQEVLDYVPIAETEIDKAVEAANQPQIPDISPRHANAGALSDWIKIYRSLRPELPAYNVYQLASPGKDRLIQLEDRNITRIKNIPEDIQLTPKQRAQVKAVKTKKRHIDTQKIKDFLSSFQYPLYFLDYETLGDVIPPFDGMSPYVQIPFQYSLHKIESPGYEAEHIEYLHEENTNPGKKFTQHLINNIGSDGTVLVWNMSFEKRINEIVAAMLPDYADFYQHLNDRINDLMIPFSRNWFVDKDFFGSASLKKVQPVLVPELKYSELDISEGGTAQTIWMETFIHGKNQEKKEEIIQNLLTYCKYDTLVMVKIHQILTNL